MTDLVDQVAIAASTSVAQARRDQNTGDETGDRVAIAVLRTLERSGVFDREYSAVLAHVANQLSGELS